MFRIAATPPFPGLRRFHDGRRFKQWTGDDSKALMKVYLPAIAGLVPDEVVQAISAFLDFCYLVRRSSINQETLAHIDEALQRFHRYREIFIVEGVRVNFLLPRQHSLKHYRPMIEDYGAPNGLCSSITESKHIKAVKEPWRRSNRFNALRQMLLTNQRLDKLAAARVDFSSRGMLNGSVLSDALTEYTRDRADAVDSGTSAQTSSGASLNAEPPPSGARDIISTLPPGDEPVVVEGPRVVGTVDMAQTPRKSGFPLQHKPLLTAATVLRAITVSKIVTVLGRVYRMPQLP